MELFILAYIIIFGLLLGSFFNVVIYRLPRKQFFRSSRSLCPHCGSKIRFYDNIPVLSFILLKRRCRDCKAFISWQYPLVEIITAAATTILYLCQEWPLWQNRALLKQIVISFLFLLIIPIGFVVMNVLRRDQGKQK